MKEFELKYGCNPNQKPSKIYMHDGSELPIEILNGRYGPYIAANGKNYKIPTGTDPASLDLAACMEIIEKSADKPATPRRRKK